MKRFVPPPTTPIFDSLSDFLKILIESQSLADIVSKDFIQSPS